MAVKYPSGGDVDIWPTASIFYCILSSAIYLIKPLGETAKELIKAPFMDTTFMKSEDEVLPAIIILSNEVSTLNADN